MRRDEISDVDAAERGLRMTGSAGAPPLGVVALREVLPADLPILCAQQQDPMANQMAAFPARDEDAFMAHWAKTLADPTVTARTVVLDGQVAGNVVSFEHDGQREIGYWIARECWGQGVATRALSLFLELVPARPFVRRRGSAERSIDPRAREVWLQSDGPRGWWPSHPPAGQLRKAVVT
jgi:hypothetical protein